jgi:hypothetical protein
MGYPQQVPPAGLYVARRQNGPKGVVHWGILNLGNRLGIPLVNGFNPVVIHQTPPRFRWEYTPLSTW